MFISFLSPLKDVVIIYENTKGNDCPDQNGKEGKTRDACIHVVNPLEDKGIRFEEEVEDRIGNREVNASEEHYGFEGDHV